MQSTRVYNIVTDTEKIKKTVIKPFLKWVGGKTQIIGDVLGLFPTEINDYYEPFLGGGSVLLGFLCLVKKGDILLKGNIYASDINPNLIGLYKNIQTHSDELINEISIIIDEYLSIEGVEVNRKASNIEEAQTSRESYYYWIRNKYNSLSSIEKLTVKGSSLFLFLNKTCFRGVYREGPNGFNVPYGHYKNPSVIEVEHIKEVSELIKEVVFVHRSFDVSLSNVTNLNDFVYLDPPYAPENTKSFVSYTSNGFGQECHTQLFETCNEIHNRGINLLMSNSDVKLVRDAFIEPKYTTNVILCRRAINSKKPDSKTNEVIIFNDL